MYAGNQVHSSEMVNPRVNYIVSVKESQQEIDSMQLNATHGQSRS
jgi:hypothetical protein